MIRVFCIDDHPLIRRGLQEHLAQEPGLEWAGEAATGTEARERLLSSRSHVVITDVRLPDADGIALCREVQDLLPEAACVVHTFYWDDTVLQDAMDAGALGFVSKNSETGHLIEAIHTTAGGQPYLDPTVSALAMGRLRGEAAAHEALDRLTPQQARILGLLGEGLSNRAIARRLGIAEKTVRNHVTRVLATLGVQSRTQAAIYATRRVAHLPPPGSPEHERARKDHKDPR